MNDVSDQQLLSDYTHGKSEAAFAEIVRRQIDLVYSAALRMVRDPHLAEDVTQRAFTALAQNAHQLLDRSTLSGWLHRTAQNLAANVVRTEVRRQAREQEAAAMSDLFSCEPDAPWEDIAPVLDDALADLNESDRDAVMLRYFERKSAREMAERFGMSEAAAQKRVSRAMERLREAFTRRGVTVGASGLAVVISTNAVHAAPVGLALTVSTSAAAVGTTATIAATAAKTIAMTTIQKSLAATVLVVAVGAGIYQGRQISNLRERLQSGEQQQGSLTEQVQKIARERDDAVAQATTLRDDNERLRRSTTEIPKLRNDASRLRQTQEEMAQLKVKARTNGAMGDVFSRLIDDPEWKNDMRKMSEKTAKATYAELLKGWNLSPETEVKMIELLVNNHMRTLEVSMGLMQGRSRADLQKEVLAERQTTDDAIKGLVGEEHFQEYKKFEDSIADRSVLAQFKGELGKNKLPQNQADQLLAVMLEERAKFPLLANRAEAAQSLKEMDAAAGQQFFQEQEQMNQQVLARAATFLDARQLESLTKVQTNSLASAQKNFRLQQRLFSGQAN